MCDALRPWNMYHRLCSAFIPEQCLLTICVTQYHRASFLCYFK